MDEVFGEGPAEAYTVGVRLALEDGVSVGIAALGDDLAMLRRVVGDGGLIDGGAMSLRAARELVPPVVPAVVEEPGVRAAGVVVRPVAAVQRPVADGAVVPEPSVVPVVVRPMVAVPGAVPLRRALEPDERAEVAVAPAASGVMAPPVVTSGETVVRENVARMLAPVVMPFERAAAPRVDAEVGGGIERERSVEVSAPSVWAPALAPVLPQSAPAGPVAGESGGAGGAVYLDGHLLGHWLAETMARETGGPMGGGVGFDGRMGPSWPGALQGG